VVHLLDTLDDLRGVRGDGQCGHGSVLQLDDRYNRSSAHNLLCQLSLSLLLLRILQTQ